MGEDFDPRTYRFAPCAGTLNPDTYQINTKQWSGSVHHPSNCEMYPWWTDKPIYGAIPQFSSASGEGSDAGPWLPQYMMDKTLLNPNAVLGRDIVSIMSELDRRNPAPRGTSRVQLLPEGQLVVAGPDDAFLNRGMTLLDLQKLLKSRPGLSVCIQSDSSTVGTFYQIERLPAFQQTGLCPVNTVYTKSGGVVIALRYDPEHWARVNKEKKEAAARNERTSLRYARQKLLRLSRPWASVSQLRHLLKGLDSIWTDDGFVKIRRAVPGAEKGDPDREASEEWRQRVLGATEIFRALKAHKHSPLKDGVQPPHTSSYWWVAYRTRAAHWIYGVELNGTPEWRKFARKVKAFIRDYGLPMPERTKGLKKLKTK